MADINIKEPVRLREKTLKSGAKSLYLDIYEDGVRSYEYLKMYLNPGNDPMTRAKNKAVLEAAKVIQARRILEVTSGQAGGTASSRKRIRFVDYYTDYYEKRPNLSDKYRQHSMCALYKWIGYAGEDLAISAITPDMIVGFVRYLESSKKSYPMRKVHVAAHGGCPARTISTEEAEDLVRDMAVRKRMTTAQISEETGISVSRVGLIRSRILEGKAGRPLQSGTARNYFRFISAVLSKAAAKGVIRSNPIAMLDPGERPQGRSAERPYLTLEEVNRLARTTCEEPLVKRMFMFACFTGLRISDVLALTWRKIDDNMIGMTMQKTRQPIYVPLSANARKWLPERGDAGPDDKVFSGCPVPVRVSRIIRHWTADAGIEKHVTFHISRHTFATLALEYGADLYTVSKLLGHQDVRTTQIYARVIDKKKEEAVNLIPEI